MIEVTVVDATIRVADRANNTIDIETVGWDQPAPSMSIPFPMDETITGRATQLSLTSTSVTASTIRADGTIDDRVQLDANDRLEMPGTEHGSLVWVTGPINTWIRFDDAGVIEQRTDRNLRISFSHPTPVTVGVQSNVAAPSQTITVSRTPAGIATALSHFSGTIVETSPDRTSNLCRGHPPRIEYGDADIPAEIRRAAMTTGIELTLPATLDALLPAASLATYLGARVSVATGAAPTLRIPDSDFVHEFAPLPAFQYEAASMLRRVFFLDMLVRWVEQSNEDWLEADALSLLEIDPARCIDVPMRERVERYLSLDFERVAPIFPDWLSNVYVEPTFENATALPALVYNLSQLYLPDASPDRGPASSSRTTASSSRESAAPRTGPRPRTRGPYVGWMGADPLEGTYQTRPEAYRNRTAYLGERDELSIAVVCTDPDRRGCRDDAIDAYRIESLPIDLTVYDEPTRDELADCIADGVDLLHVIGPCRDGFACADGTLSPADLERSNVRSFFLDGAGSRATGLALLTLGSVAGAVWTESADPVAAAETRKVFLTALVGGVTFQLSKRYACAYGDETNPLTILGDGLSELVSLDQLQVFPIEIDSLGDRQFRVRVPILYTDPGIGYGGLSLDHWQFAGNEFDRTLTADELVTLLETRQYLVVVDGDVYRPDDLGPFEPMV